MDTIGPPEPYCPRGRRPHHERIPDIVRMLAPGKTGGVVIDDTPEHRAYYLYHLSIYPDIEIVWQGKLASSTYMIKIKKREG